MNKYLFLFTIGPVQSFIAQARKTQDLYAGSQLLSNLIEKAMEELKKKVQNPEFIFPDEDIKSKPNRFVAEVETDQDIKEIGENLKNTVKDEFDKIAKQALASLNVSQESNFTNYFNKQIKDFLQVYWVALPLTEDNYPNIYEKLEKNLGAIKNVRVFHQLEETGKKCSLCGERNVLFDRLTDDEKEKGGLRLRKDGLLKKLYVKREEVAFFEPQNESDNLKIQKGEGLCAVCFAKRFYKTRNFPSTAEIAAMDWIENISDKDKYKNLFKNFDEQLYYDENLREEYLNKYGHPKDEQILSNAKEQLKKIYEQAGKPKKYYALLMLDGDNMGKWLSGEFLEDEDKKNLKDFHKTLSKELGKYAKNVTGGDDKEAIIKDPKGKVVYAGGDDVMAFVNLKYLLPVMNGLRAKFPKFEELGFKLKADQKSSASAGIVITHYKTPLSEVLKWARKMEKEAKEKGGRDAFAIAVLKHSGEIHKTVWKWDLYNENSKTIRLLENLVKELLDDENGFSNTFIKNLNEEFARLDEIDDKWMKAELKRLLYRASQIKGNKEIKKNKVNKWQDRLFNLFIDSTTKDNFLSFLNIADFLARRTK